MEKLKLSVFFQKFPFENEEINVKEYFDEYAKHLHPIEPVSGKNVFTCKKLQNDFYAKQMELTPEELEELNEVTSETNLDCIGEIKPIEHKLHESSSDFLLKYEMSQFLNTEEHSLASVKARQKIQGDVFARYNLKYEQYIWLSDENFPEIRQNLNPFDFSTLVFCVKVYHPYVSQKGQLYRMKLLQEIHILGDQFLSELKDKIICSMDYCGIHDASNHLVAKSKEIELRPREDYPSSFIFIGNTFYNDTRQSYLKDLSEVIREWSTGRAIGTFSTASMERTKMLDLRLQIGRPYVYQHQADCEHIIMVSDIRFLNCSDPLKRKNFPKVYAQGRCSGKYCMMCGETYARWLVTNNKRLTHDKTYFCNNCFKSYNYIDGKKVGEFQAFEYIDSIAVL